MKVLFYDLEVSPMLCWTYKRWDASVVHVERESHLLCFAYKYLDDENVNVVSLLDFPSVYKKNPYDDSALTHALWAVLNDADIVVAHNANKFDNKVANERFLYHGLVPSKPKRTIDTLALSRKLFYNSSNSLANLCAKLGIGEKPKDTHSTLWHDCINGDMEAWSMMMRYCISDVVLLENLYLRIRPFITNHPALTNDYACPKCGSENVQKRGFKYTDSARYQQYQCQSCGGWSRDRLRDKTADMGKVVSS